MIAIAVLFRVLPDPSNGLDRSCEAMIYPVLDKPHTAGALRSPGASNYRRYIRPF
jgi:hypothetical protein